MYDESNCTGKRLAFHEACENVQPVIIYSLCRSNISIVNFYSNSLFLKYYGEILEFIEILIISESLKVLKHFFKNLKIFITFKESFFF